MISNVWFWKTSYLNPPNIIRLEDLYQYTLLLFAQASLGIIPMSALHSAAPFRPSHMLTHISLICSNVGIIDPEQLLQWALSFFFSSVSPRPERAGGSPSVSKTSNLLRRCRIPPKTPHKWSSPLHLRRLRRHLFSLFWQAFLRSSPLQPPFAALSPALPLCPHSPPFIWSSSWVRCSHVFQSQLPASEEMRRGGRRWREALPYLDK